MSFLIVNEGKEFFLKRITLQIGPAPTYKIGLYMNDYDPTANSTKASFTELPIAMPPMVPGVENYAQKTLQANDWTLAFTSGDFKATHSAVTFAGLKTFGSPPPAVTVYGFFVYETGGNKLLFAGRLSAPVTLNPNNGIDVTTPQLVLDFACPPMTLQHLLATSAGEGVKELTISCRFA
jgi:hypothetical protein